MGDKITSLHSRFSVNGEVSDKDTRFMSITIDLMHTEENLNGSYFEKDVVDDCIESIKNTPVLGFVKCDKHTGENDFLGHEHALVRTENGVEEKYLGSCYGVIPESCNPRWTTKMCDDGKEREFLQVDALLWEKFSDATDILRRDGEKAESMELEISSVEGYEDESGIFHFTKFRFDGACLLGEGVQPAMVGANAKINEVQFAVEDFAKSIQGELNDKFKAFSKLIENENQGGVSDMTKTNTDFAQTVMEQFEDISVMVSQYETVENRWGDKVPRFYLADIQDDEVIVVDRQDCYRYYGFPFSVNGDKPEIDFASDGKRKKIRYEDYEEGAASPDVAFDFGKHIADIEETAFEKVDEANTKASEFETKFTDAEQAKEKIETDYSQIKADYDEIKPQYDEYVKAEEQRKADELNSQKDAMFAEFENELADNVEFAALKEKKDEMSVKDIEAECCILFAKAVRSKANFSNVNSNDAAVGVLHDNDEAADGYVRTKYGSIHVER